MGEITDESDSGTEEFMFDKIDEHAYIFEGKTTGTSIGFQIQNTNQRSKDYSHNVDVYRPSHADYTYDQKYGVRDHRGGGRSSARETANWIVAGALAVELTVAICDVQVLELADAGTEFDKLHADMLSTSPAAIERAGKMEKDVGVSANYYDQSAHRGY